MLHKLIDIDAQVDVVYLFVGDAELIEGPWSLDCSATMRNWNGTDEALMLRHQVQLEVRVERHDVNLWTW